ncbi:MAG TPA: glycosyltransferase family 39 protein [Chthoniobacterales bacterium]|nr:glycosyltransferase family 39 protein [Chthoniobacterales bacterium]
MYTRSKWIIAAIVLSAVVVRLIHIEQPFIDPWSWRQSDVAAIARNYLENGFRFCWPQIDWAGNAEGYVGTEFPLLPFAAALCYKITGVQEWVGRIQGVIFFATGLPFFFLLVRRIYGEVAAVWATFFYAFAPLSIVASRAFMPDVPSLSLALAGIYFFLRWVERNGRRALIVSALVISFSFLIKLPTVVIGLPLLYLALAAVCDRRTFSSHGGALSEPPSGNDRSEERDALASEDGGLEAAAPWRDMPKRLLTSWELWLFATITLIPSAIWYWHAHRIAETFYPYHFFGGGGFRIMHAGWYWKIAEQTVRSSLTPVLFVLALAGVFVVPRGKYSRTFHWWLAAMVAFVFFVGWGNRHQWYQLPLVPIAAVFAGCACQWMASRLGSHRAVATLTSVLLIAGFGISSYHSARPLYRPAAAGLRNLGLELKEATTSNAVIIAADDGDPTVFYYAHRKGWHFLEEGIYQGNPFDSAQVIANLEKLRGRGASHLVFYSGTRWWLDYYREFAERVAASATLVEETPEFTIYKLEPVP